MHFSTLLAVTAACILPTVVARPSRHHHHVHRQVDDSNVVYVTVTADVPTATSAALPSAAPSSNANVNVNANVNTNVNVNTTGSGSASGNTNSGTNGGASTGSGSGSASSSGSTSGISFTKGIVYSPYQSGGGCKDAGTVQSDIARLSQYDLIRIYDTDCSGLNNVLAALGSNQRVIAGIYDITKLSESLSTITSACNGNWAKIHSVAVGNEAVFNGQASVSSLVSAMSTARSTLQQAGYTGPVVTVEAQNIINANPSLCDASDFVAANIHPFFNADCPSSNAGSWVSNQISMLESSCKGKTVIVTETGWPHAGSANGAAIPSPQDQQTAISSLSSTLSSNVVFFTAFDDLWKTSTGEFGVEKSWGIMSGQ